MVQRMQVVGYIRVSTAEQAADGVSLGAQRDKLVGYCRLHDLELLSIHRDEASAKSLTRPGLAAALACLDSGEAAGLVVAKLDRLTRSLADWQELITRYFGPDRRHQLMAVSDSIDTRTAAGRMVLNLLLTVAQWEREVIAERTVEALTHKRGKGERVGTVPYGSRLAPDGVHVEPDSAELSTMRRLAELRAAGHSLRSAGALLILEGHLPRRGNAWSVATLARLSRRMRLEGGIDGSS